MPSFASKADFRHPPRPSGSNAHLMPILGGNNLEKGDNDFEDDQKSYDYLEA
jgi:hypothetical protein